MYKRISDQGDHVVYNMTSHCLIRSRSGGIRFFVTKEKADAFVDRANALDEASAPFVIPAESPKQKPDAVTDAIASEQARTQPATVVKCEMCGFAIATSGHDCRTYTQSAYN